MPPFTPAVCKGEHKGQSVSSNTQADVKRALALAGISQLTFDWDVKDGGNSPWNSTVELYFIQQWVNTKCWEIREAASLAGENYNQIKVAKAAKAQFERWQKKIKENRCLMVAQAVHHQTITINQQLYGHSQKLFVTGNGIKGVAQDLPVDCYNEAWWQGLPPYDQETLTTVEAINLAE
ncbi:hypothetical protein PCANC_19679, partial [Puccinia coronata f. sp. avenae]